MITAFIVGLLATVAVLVVTAIAFLGLKWLKSYVLKRMKEKQAHKVAFVSTREAVDSYLRTATSEVPMDELEQMCEQKPYVSALVDEKTGDIVDYEAVKPEEVDENFQANMERMDGIMVFG